MLGLEMTGQLTIIWTRVLKSIKNCVWMDPHCGAQCSHTPFSPRQETQTCTTENMPLCVFICCKLRYIINGYWAKLHPC